MCLLCYADEAISRRKPRRAHVPVGLSCSMPGRGEARYTCILRCQVSSALVNLRPCFIWKCELNLTTTWKETERLYRADVSREAGCLS